VNQGTAVMLAAAVLLFGGLVFIVRQRYGVSAPPSTASAAAPATAPAPGAPVAIEDVVEGKLRVRVFSHVVAAESSSVPCWTFVSDGLLAVGQKELAFTVKREPDEPEAAYPRELLHLYEDVFWLAGQEKKIVDEGDFTRLGDEGPGLLRSDFRGVLYTPPQRLEGVTTSGPYLTAIVVTAGEVDAAAKFGFVRIMALLGQEYRFFPTTPWLDRRRSEIASPQALSSSLLAKIRRVRLKSGSVRQEAAPGGKPATLGQGGTVVLRLKPEAKEELAQILAQVPPEEPVAFLVNPDPEADTCMTWRPGQRAPVAIAAPGALGAKLAGNFIAFGPESGVDSAAQRIEDGFSLILAKESWEKVRAALVHGEPITIPGVGDEMSFAVSWIKETYQNPVDGQKYVASGGWLAYGPSSTASAVAPDPNAPVQPAGITLLQDQDEMEARITVEDLASYVLRVHDLLQKEIGGGARGAGYDLLVQIEIVPPRQVKPRLAARPSAAAPDELQSVVTHLEALQPPEVRGGPVRFQMAFRVWGGSGEPMPGPM
jgi:hypothetical protein